MKVSFFVYLHWLSGPGHLCTKKVVGTMLDCYWLQMGLVLVRFIMLDNLNFIVYLTFKKFHHLSFFSLIVAYVQIMIGSLRTLKEGRPEFLVKMRS
jgi:hypothetical protein